jgi:hypothetical protein
MVATVALIIAAVIGAYAGILFRTFALPVGWPLDLLAGLLVGVVVFVAGSAIRNRQRA